MRIWNEITSLLTRALTVETGRVAMDSLEPRSLLSNTPLPQLSDLENTTDTVVRIETSMGDIDIELFNGAAPVTVTNFLNYVTSGRLDNTFFHRSVTSPNPFVLQGGGYSYSDAGGFGSVTTDAPIIRESTGRSNLARTVAMARTNNINSATSQFFINYDDNTFLDPTGPSDGYAVFGKVIQGWDIVTAIQALSIEDLSGDPAFAGPNAGVMGEVPVTGQYSPVSGVRENALVQLVNAEIIKPAQLDGFFAQTVVYPEGFRSSSSTENLELVNPNSDSGSYQVIVHYELGNRDVVIASGTIAAHTQMEIKLSSGSDSSLTLLRSDTPYSIEVQSAFGSDASSPQPISATMHRVDFGALEGEGFFNPAGYSDAQLKTWDFARIERSSTSREFLTWQSLSDTIGIVTVSFVTPTGTVTVTRNVEPYRRGGLDLASLSLPEGTLAAHVTSTQPIVAALSDWDLNPATPIASPQVPFTPAFGVLGIPGGGANIGGLANVSDRTGYTDVISVYNPTNTVAAITFQYWTASRTNSQDPVSRLEIVLSGARRDIELDAGLLGIGMDEDVSVTYSSGSTNIIVQFTSFPTLTRSGAVSASADRDGYATTFQNRVPGASHFADGFTDPTRNATTQGETVTIFNLYAAQNITFSYTIRYTFSDGTTIDAFTGQIDPLQRVSFKTLDSTSVMAKVQSGAAFHTYAISVLGTSVNGATTLPISGLTTFSRWDSATGRDVLTTGTPSDFGVSMNDPQFQPAT